MKRFEEIPHTADWSFRAFGKDLRELFENAAFAMFALQGGTSRDLERDGSKGVANGARETARTVEVDGIDHESLLVNWLSELLYLQEMHREFYHRFHVETISPPTPLGTTEPVTLRAQVFGMPIAHLDKVIKAVTYHNLKIEQTPTGWEAVVVVDV